MRKIGFYEVIHLLALLSCIIGIFAWPFPFNLMPFALVLWIIYMAFKVYLTNWSGVFFGDIGAFLEEVDS